MTVQDLEVFILTCNRAPLLKKAVTSLLQQSVSGFPITVLDNASTDDTASVMASFKDPSIRMIGSEQNLGGLGNLKRSQQFASHKYAMIFHDDDQLHPEYIETALRRFREHPEAGLVLANGANIDIDTIPIAPRRPNPTALKLDRVHFATACYLRNKFAFSSAIYRTNLLKSLELDGLFAAYGKWGDRPMMIESLRNQSAIILNGIFVYSGRHAGQDTHSKATQPPHTLWLNRERYFHDIMGDSTSSFSGLSFCMMNSRRIKSGYKRRIIEGTTFNRYLEDAFKLGATTERAWKFRFIAPKPVQAIFNRYAQSYLRRHYLVPVG